MAYEQLLSDYKQALATQDWHKVAPLIHQDACFIFSEGTYLGKAAIEAAITRTFNLIKSEHYAIKNLVWVCVTDLCATCTYEFDWSGLIDGVSEQGSGRGTTVAVNNDGVWSIVHEHLGPSAG
ncbi:nuclear transport factor 2 family protein [Iodobacter sp. CM08]|uniref:YybH family protein n=1 Tax=Iodobacter sp. CM08 TaxID=3085902 RepID=UPI002981E943|nr:nuclear transport factor 2 family protein [Iodobacter sp. CM08]MDW5416904.1 nuclear transport factor 2 family protein [Iodobacter sp. CM08]